MVTVLNESYQDYKKRKEIQEGKKLNVVLIMVALIFCVAGPTLWFLEPQRTWDNIAFFSFVMSFFGIPLAGIYNVIYNDNVPSFDDFVMQQFKQKYTNCVWINSSLNYQNGDKFYKVEKFNPLDDSLEVISREISAFYIEIIK